MTQKIETIIDGVVSEIRNHGISSKTVVNYQDRLLKPIILYCHQHGEGYYSPVLTSAYLSERTKQLKDGIITDHYYRSIKRMVQYTDVYASTGRIDFRKPGKKIYNPPEQYTEVLECIISNNPTLSASIVAIIRHFFCFIDEKKVELRQVTESLFFDFMVSVSETNRTNQRKILIALQLITDYIVTKHQVHLNINFLQFRLKKAAVKAIPPYSKEELNKIFMAIDTNEPYGQRDLAILMLAFSTGLRGCDIIHLKLADIDWKTSQLNIHQKKTLVPLLLPLNTDTMNAIAEYILRIRPTCNVKEIFVTLRAPYKALKTTTALDSILRKYCKKANIKVINWRGFHSLRRSFATEMSASEVPLTTISQMLGHTNTNSDKPYLSYNRHQILFCAIGFKEIPIVSGFYARKDGLE